MTTLRLLLLLTALCGVVYPLALTVLARAVFPDRANGSLVVRNGRIIGSSLIGQASDDPRYFWSRPSATPKAPYNAALSSGSNWGPNHPDRKAALAERRHALQAADPGNPAHVPADLLTASASGLDPHISPQAAFYQVSRVARARGLAPAVVAGLVSRSITPRQFGVLGEPAVNVLLLNLELDRL